VNDLHDLLHDAVADVEPADRLAELRARTANPARAAARPWFWAAGATVLATAAAVAVVAVVSDGSDAPGHHHHDMAMDPPASTQLVAAYFIGDGPDGPRLFREFDDVPAGDPLQRALDRILQPANDPDYTTAWEPGILVGATATDSTIDVEVVGGKHLRIDDLAAQQVVYTLQGTLGEQLPVRFVQGDRVVLGPIDADPSVLNLVSISDPAEGNEYSGSMEARGRERWIGGALSWELTDTQGDAVLSGLTTEHGSAVGTHPWEATVNLEGLEPGVYNFTVRTRDLGGFTTTPFVPSTDTRTINVR
jgi:hypothetical protein